MQHEYLKLLGESTILERKKYGIFNKKKRN